MEHQGIHDHALVALSILIAAAASYTSIDLAGRIKVARGFGRRAWLAVSSVAMGGGIWSMHFVAMLAFSMPGMEVVYDVGLTVISLVVPIMVTGIAFHIVNRSGSGWHSLILSGLFMGTGIAAMHYIGMAAMRMPAALSYEAIWVATSILIAIGASSVALWLAFKNTDLRRKFIAAVAMGVAISGMHYAAMEGAVFELAPTVEPRPTRSSLGQTNLALGVAAVTFVILFSVLAASMVDRRLVRLSELQTEAVKRREEAFRALYRRTPVPLHAFDDRGIIREVSDAWLDLIGQDRDRVIGRPLSSFMTAEAAHRFTGPDWERLKATGNLTDVEYQLVSEPAGLLDVLFSARIEPKSPSVLFWATGGITDVTERRRTEEALRQAQKMEAIGRLTGGVAHDFNNLLAAILGSLRNLQKRIPDEPETKKLVDNAMQGAERGATLTQRMLAFAREQRLNTGVIDLPSLVGGMTDLLERTIGTEIRIERAFAPELSHVEVDANQLELALLNLAVNARDATPDGGTIRIGAREATRREVEEILGTSQDYACLFVSDTGEGMDSATLARACDPFFTTKPIGKGTGLGLSMVHGFATQSGGTLRLRSRHGEGTTAEIFLPVARQHPDPADCRQESYVVSGRTKVPPIRILVVDDDKIISFTTVMMLEDLGFRALEARNVKAALEIVRADEGVDLVITDQGMPEMTGIELAGILRSEQPDLPILLATGYAEVPAAEGLGVNVLGKPFTEEQLLAAINDAVTAT